MKIVFMGTPDFAVPSLELLLKNGFGVAAVVTAPDKPRGRGQQVSYTAVKECALRHGIPLLQPESLKDPRFASQLAAAGADLFVVVAFRILPKQIYTLPRLGSFNLHASLLPKYRGAAPINWAIINGETESGVTTFFLQESVDTGSVILQRSVPIGPEMNAGMLHDALSQVGADVVLETVRMIEQGNVRTQPQDDRNASPAPKIFKETCRIAWDRSSLQVKNHIRGLSPYPAAWTMLHGKVLKIFNVSIDSVAVPDHTLLPGTIRTDGRSFAVRSAEGWIEILELQLEGKKRMGTEEFLRGYRLASGDRFE